MKLTSIEALLSVFILSSQVSAWASHRIGLARSSTRLAAALALKSDHGGSRSSIDVDVSGDGSKILTFETGVIGKQAAGAAMVSCGGTVVYTTACFSPKSEDFDFIPLKIDYQERKSAAGMTKGGYLKRDGRASDDEILVSRLIDRPIRPMITEGWTHDTQVLSWVLSYDGKHQPSPLAVCGASAALLLSDIPLTKPVAAVEVGMDRATGGYIVNPTKDEQADSPLIMTLAGTADGVLMIEGAADFLTEAQMVKAVEVAHQAVARICNALADWSKEVGKPKKTDTLRTVPLPLKDAVKAAYGDRVFDMLRLTDPEVGGKDTNQGREEMSAIRAAVVAEFGEEFGATACEVAVKKLCSAKMRQLVKDTGRRCDGRSADQVREISVDTGVLPGTHGSALFTRGATQALCVATLGSGSDFQRGENLDGDTTKRFYLQYAFPPCSVGEVGRTGAPGRREVGHGNLAERALMLAVPEETAFPYSMRVESLITESSGSSSMASVCGGCLALMDAGVPLSRMVAGVAMGLILDEESLETSDDDAVVLTDILGLEDGLGTMDFKVGGDAQGISTLQLDIKCEGLSIALLTRALEQARQGRLHILDKMTAAMPNGSRASLPDTVPKLQTLTIPMNAIGKVIGPGGKMIRSLIDDFGLSDVNIKEDGSVSVSGFDDEKIAECVKKIEELAGAAGGEGNGRRAAYEGPMPEVGTLVNKCEVVSVKAFGVFVKLGDEYPGLEGLVHISELHTERVRNIDGFIQPGATIDVKVIGLSDDGKLKLSRKAALAAPA